MANFNDPHGPSEAPDSPENKYRRAIQCIDLLFPYFPDFEEVNITRVADKAPLSQNDKLLIPYLKYEIDELLIERFGYVIKRYPGDFYGRLSDKGKEAKAAGGHTKYLEQLQNRKEKEGARQLKADEKTEQDLRNARFEERIGRRLKFWAVVVPLGSMIVAATSAYFTITRLTPTENNVSDSAVQSLRNDLEKTKSEVKNLQLLTKKDTVLQRSDSIKAKKHDYK